jgi:hypothetical protein
MNSQPGRPVENLVVWCFGVALAGCVPVDGGAVELSWTVRSLGDPYGCVREVAGRVVDRIGDISLCARACTVIVDGQCVGDAVCPVRSWPCERLMGATRFEIVAGRKELWIEVGCPDGTPANVVVPEPVVRDIADGEVTQLNALLITVPANGVACVVQ